MGRVNLGLAALGSNIMSLKMMSSTLLGLNLLSLNTVSLNLLKLRWWGARGPRLPTHLPLSAVRLLIVVDKLLVGFLGA